MSNKKIEKLIKKIDKHFDSKKAPNIYKFLVDKSISSDIAQDAQSMCYDFFYSLQNLFIEEITRNIHAEVEDIEKNLDKINEKITDAYNILNR